MGQSDWPWRAPTNTSPPNRPQARLPMSTPAASRARRAATVSGGSRSYMPRSRRPEVPSGHRRGSPGAGPARSGDFAPGWRSPTKAAGTPPEGPGKCPRPSRRVFPLSAAHEFSDLKRHRPGGGSAKEGGPTAIPCAGGQYPLPGASRCTRPRRQHGLRSRKSFTPNRPGMRPDTKLSRPGLNYGLLTESQYRCLARSIARAQSCGSIPPPPPRTLIGNPRSALSLALARRLALNAQWK